MWNRRDRARGVDRASSGIPHSMSDLEERLQDLSFAGPSPTIPRAEVVATTSNLSEIVMNPVAQLPLLDFPPEIIDEVLSHLSPADLAQIACTCRTLRNHAGDDKIWCKFAKDLELPVAHELPSPFGNWKEFYASHYPYWILPKHKIWFGTQAAGGQPFTGQVLLARYDYRTGHIEALRLRAHTSQQNTFQTWSWNPTVIIHLFDPVITLDAEDPVVRLEIESHDRGGRLKNEIQTTRGFDRDSSGLRSTVFLAREIPPKWQDTSMVLWPPTIFPTIHKVRNDSGSDFKDPGHKPSCHAQMSEACFRTRVWLELNAGKGRTGFKHGEHVVTFSTLPKSCYTPTPEKPYQGIWVGDYSGHGCEFLLVTQKSKEEAEGIPPVTLMTQEERDRMTGGQPAIPLNPNQQASSASPTETDDSLGCSGRLEAIKLTGDTNIPKGEYTFIVEDMGHRGLIRVANEPEFKGARIVRCLCHVASRGFIGDGYIRSQLILMSNDRMAQYWEEFGHISFFRRVNIDDYLDVGEGA